MSLLANLFKYQRNQAVADYERCILAALEPAAEPVSLLDCGCDDGRWTLELGRRLGQARLFGLEIVPQRRRLAQQRGVEVRAADLNRSFPFPSALFDVVHANQVIGNLADTDNFIQEIWRVLKPGDYAVICTENLASWHNIFALLWGWQSFSLANVCQTRFQIGNPLAIHNGEAAATPKSWQHLRVFAYRGLRDIFIEYGFQVERYAGSGYSSLPQWVSKLDPRHAAFLTLNGRKPVR